MYAKSGATTTRHTVQAMPGSMTRHATGPKPHVLFAPLIESAVSLSQRMKVGGDKAGALGGGCTTMP